MTTTSIVMIATVAITIPVAIKTIREAYRKPRVQHRDRRGRYAKVQETIVYIGSHEWHALIKSWVNPMKKGDGYEQ